MNKRQSSPSPTRLPVVDAESASKVEQAEEGVKEPEDASMSDEDPKATKSTTTATTPITHRTKRTLAADREATVQRQLIITLEAQVTAPTDAAMSDAQPKAPATMSATTTPATARTKRRREAEREATEQRQLTIALETHNTQQMSLREAQRRLILALKAQDQRQHLLMRVKQQNKEIRLHIERIWHSIMLRMLGSFAKSAKEPTPRNNCGL
jgi:hypothetical protein